MAASRVVIVFALLCISIAWGLQESTRRAVSPFQIATPQVHLHNINGRAGTVAPLQYTSSLTTEDSHAIALDLAEQILAFPVTYNVKNSYVSKHNKIRHVYLKQTAADGREIFNADLNINVVNKRALNLGHSFFNGSTAVPAVPGQLSSMEALKHFLAFARINPAGSELHVVEESEYEGVDLKHSIEGVKGSLSPARITAGYFQVDNGQRLEPVWDIQLDMDNNYWNAFVSMRTGEVVTLFDWVNDLNSFNIYPIGVNDPSDGNRTIVTDPATTASPLGWNSQGATASFTTTAGNNVYAQANPTGGSTWLNLPRPSGGSTLDFNYSIDLAEEPDTYSNASTVNLFAWNNFIHDIFYGYGFDEVSGNFQENNFGRGGLGNDAVTANCQDGSGENNANFATPPDGQRPRMRMYTWTLSDPNRDGDLDAGIIIHEYAHGISNRLTGGPANSNCLGSGEPGGMGEGWGDFFATVLRQRPDYVSTDQFTMGAYSANNPLGIRKYPYTTDMKVDPETYGFINNASYSGVHAKGEVWCGILWETYWNLVDVYGFDTNVYNGIGGNNKILQLVTDGMKLQPCNPNFVDARNAILLADSQNYGGVNSCALWRGFAKRGLGVNAVGGRPGSPLVKQDFTVPAEC